MNVEGVPYYRSEQETIEYLRGHDAAIVSFEPINERTLGALPLTVTKLTRDLCDAATAKLRHCVLINTARGRIVDETALKEALNFLPEPGIYRFGPLTRRSARLPPRAPPRATLPLAG